MKPGRITRWAARHRAGVMAATAVLMIILGSGILRLEFRDDPLDAMPRGDPHTEAADALIDTFPGASYASAIFIEIAPEKWAAATDMLPNRVPLDETQADGSQNQVSGILESVLQQGSQGEAPPGPDPYPGPGNITDEIYMRGMEELFLFLVDEIPELNWGITLPSQVKLVNYTNTGIPGVQPPDPAAFAVPGTDPAGSMQYSAAWTTYWYASLDSIKSIVSSDWETTRFGLLFEPGPDQSINVIGQKLYDAVEAYRDEVRSCDAGGPCSLTWNVFEADGITVDPRPPTTAASYLSKVTLEDVVRLAPFVAAFIGASLFIAFRRVGIVSAMLLPMGLAGIGVLGAFGLIDLPIHSVSLLVFPILMGNGIDFAIHMASAYNEARGEGQDPIDAAEAAGDRAGTPLLIATMTTLAGMLLLIFAPNKLLTQLGLSILIGMVLLLAISLTALPAALTWTRPVAIKRTAIGRALAANARFWNRKRWAAFGVVALLAGGSLLSVGQLSTLIIGTPAAYFPEDDPQRRDFEESNAEYFVGFENLVSNAIVLQGDLATPAAMALLRDLEQEIKTLDFVRPESSVSIYFALNAWIQVREGSAGAPAVIAQETVQPGSTFPDNEEDVRALLDEMFATPLETYATFFIDHPDYQIGNMLVEIEQADDFAQLEEDWEAFQAVLARVQARHPDADIEMHLAGGTAIGYLFAKEELPYVQVASVVGLGMTGLLVYAIRRNARDALTVAAVVGGATLLWVGTLGLADIPLSVALVVPVVMIAAIGSDYALHLRYGLRREGAAAWDSVGRAVFFSAVTDLGAFAIFTQMRYGILSAATWATVFALGCCLVMTLILVPALAKPSELEHHAS